VNETGLSERIVLFLCAHILRKTAGFVMISKKV